ncbi:MAG: DnaA/Hda family protein [Planctomycetota bacterium]|nr:DnaA/Hda family protein [Planctomycetota bacterium]
MSDRILGRLSAQVGSATVERYFDRRTSVRVDGRNVRVTAPSRFAADLLSRRLGEPLRRVINEELPGADVRIAVEETEAPSASASPAPVPTSPTTSSPGAPIVSAPTATASIVREPTRAMPRRGSLSPARYRLEDFVVGAANRLAYSATIELVQDPQRAKAYSPLVIHGECGLGKTHLLHGAVQRSRQLFPDRQARYVTAEAFTNDFIAAVRANKVDAFRKAYKQVQLLAIDDLHFLAGKDATQSELLHIFDELDLSGAVVMLASDEHPGRIEKLSRALQSRFVSGAVVALEAPDPELRSRLVRKLAETRGLRLEEAAVSLLAERSARAIGTLGGFGGSVREIEGLLTQVEAVFRLLPEFSGLGSGSGSVINTTGAIGAALVRRALGLDGPGSGMMNPGAAADVALANFSAAAGATRTGQALSGGTGSGSSIRASVLSPGALRARQPIPAEVIAQTVCRLLGVTIPELMGRTRHRRVVLARGVSVILCRRLTTLSFPEIARALGRPNHSTVITAHQRLEGSMREGSLVQELCPEVMQDRGAAQFGGMTATELCERLAEEVRRAAADPVGLASGAAAR